VRNRLALVALAGLPTAGLAQCSHPVAVTTAHEKVVVKEVALPFPVPYALFQFVGGVTTPPPVLIAAPPPPAPAQAPAAPPAVAPVAPAVEARLARIEAVLARLAEARAPADGPPVAAGGDTLPVALPAAPPGPAPAPAAPPAARVRTDYPGALGPAVAVLAARGCAACHTGAAARPREEPVVLWDDSGAWAPSVSWRAIHAAVRPRTGPGGDLPARMPKGSPAKLTPEDVALVKAVAGGTAE
jgi:hypothetical protein